MRQFHIYEIFFKDILLTDATAYNILNWGSKCAQEKLVKNQIGDSLLN